MTDSAENPHEMLREAQVQDTIVGLVSNLYLDLKDPAQQTDFKNVVNGYTTLRYRARIAKTYNSTGPKFGLRSVERHNGEQGWVLPSSEVQHIRERLDMVAYPAYELPDKSLATDIEMIEESDHPLYQALVYCRDNRFEPEQSVNFVRFILVRQIEPLLAAELAKPRTQEGARVSQR